MYLGPNVPHAYLSGDCVECMANRKTDILFQNQWFFAVFRIRFILIWIRILGSVSWNNRTGSKSDLKSGKYQLFFSIKNIFLRNMIYFVIYGVNIYVSKHKFNSFEKNVWYSNDFVDFCWNFPLFWLIFCYPDPADQNETDPNGSGSETLLLNISCFSLPLYL